MLHLMANTAWSMTPPPSTYFTHNKRLYDSLYVSLDLYAPVLTLLQLNYHLYTQSRPEALQGRFFLPDNLREELQKRSEATWMSAPSGLSLPEELQGYHSLAPLESIASERRKFLTWSSTVYKAVNSVDGCTYVLRRIESPYKSNTESEYPLR